LLSITITFSLTAFAWIFFSKFFSTFFSNSSSFQI
jgi:hypothetical protein